ncbi:family 16 glycosylhydrolase [Asticcacaulis solisilvae]|uniref:family 16 glycosylhydrolase n=1 Tax=Asticcacaulis solisilvae TaxID=1217274 RepID=UPI003FD8A966
MRHLVWAIAAMMLSPLPAAAQTVQPAWSESFDRLDPATWETQLFSFPANGCNMTAAQVSVQSGTLTLSLEKNPSVSPSAPKMCNAGEIGSYRFFSYGLFTVRMKAPAVSGGVSAFFLMNRWQPENWEHKEIDIEVLGRRATAVQLTTHDFQNGGRDWKSAATTVDLGFDYSRQAHDYAILWTPQAVRWFVDGRLLHTETQYVPHEPLQIRMNIYLGDPAETGITQWLGPIDGARLPAAAEYGGIAYYPLDALPAAFSGYAKPSE